MRDLNGIESDTTQLDQRRCNARSCAVPTHVEERLTDGELFFRLQDYIRASVIFTDIVDNYPQHRAYPDALFLLAESLFKAGDFLGARARYREIIRAPDQPRVFALRPARARAPDRDRHPHARLRRRRRLLHAPEQAAALGSRGRDELLPRQVPLQRGDPRRTRAPPTK